MRPVMTFQGAGSGMQAGIGVLQFSRITGAIGTRTCNDREIEVDQMAVVCRVTTVYAVPVMANCA